MLVIWVESNLTRWQSQVNNQVNSQADVEVKVGRMRLVLIQVTPEISYSAWDTRSRSEISYLARDARPRSEISSGCTPEVLYSVRDARSSMKAYSL